VGKQREMSVDEQEWRDEGRRRGWPAPIRRQWYRRLPVIRHVAALNTSWRVHAHAARWASYGVGVGGPNPYDLWVLDGRFHGFV
jgi:hypothetical protein